MNLAIQTKKNLENLLIIFIQAEKLKSALGAEPFDFPIYLKHR